VTSKRERDLDRVDLAANVKVARIRFEEEFGIAHDSNKIDAAIEKLYEDAWVEGEATAAVPLHLLKAVLLRQGGTGSKPGRKPEPNWIRRGKELAIRQARKRIASGEDREAVIADAAKKSQLSPETIRDRISRRKYK
jgi:hypothetical protein